MLMTYWNSGPTDLICSFLPQAVLALRVGTDGSSLQEAEEVLQQIFEYSVNTSHRHFYNQLYGGIDEVTLAASWLIEALNTNVHTYEAAPVFTLVESFVIGRLVELFGWLDGEGIFCPGVTKKVFQGHHNVWEYHKSVAGSLKSVAVLQEEHPENSHYSFKKGAVWLGLGTDNVVSVETDTYGRMLPQALRKAVKEARERGGEPFFVGATAGTTVLGAFDPLEEIADVCQEEGLWLHADACWGGSAILSNTHKHLLQGIHSITMADSALASGTTLRRSVLTGAYSLCSTPSPQLTQPTKSPKSLPDPTEKGEYLVLLYGLMEEIIYWYIG
nr:acidic amino acid decarboxylase GADL1-like [Cherax quadricarinatus]